MRVELVKLLGEVLSSLIWLEVSQFLSQVWLINDRVDGKYLWQDGDKLFEFSAIIDSQLSGYLSRVSRLSSEWWQCHTTINITQHVAPLTVCQSGDFSVSNRIIKLWS